MAEKSQRISGVAERYASSLYELASAAKSVDAVGKDLDLFSSIVEGNDELKRLVSSPVFASSEQLGAIAALAEKSKVGDLTGNFLKVVARNRRLQSLSEIVAAYHEITARERGEATAYVQTARPLTAAQEKELAATLSIATGKKVATRVTVEPALLGGMIVQVGSRQIDTSLRTKLSTLKHALKEVG